MSAKTKEAMILLYPSNEYNHQELRTALGKFCQTNNISVIDIISFMDEYDYLAICRLSRVIKYNTKPISLVTNKDLSVIIPILALLSIMEATNLTDSFDIVLDFLRDFKEKSHGTQKTESFQIVLPEELKYMSESMSYMQYSIKRNLEKEGGR